MNRRSFTLIQKETFGEERTILENELNTYQNGRRAGRTRHDDSQKRGRPAVLRFQIERFFSPSSPPPPYVGFLWRPLHYIGFCFLLLGSVLQLGSDFVWYGRLDHSRWVHHPILSVHRVRVPSVPYHSTLRPLTTFSLRSTHQCIPGLTGCTFPAGYSLNMI